MTYRPFTLEGNFAFASGIQEMLIQSQTGIVHVFPAIPREWKDISFFNLRTEGAFLISSSMKKGEIKEIELLSEKGGLLKLYNPFTDTLFKASSPIKVVGNIITIETKPGQKIRITN
jgi:alpha-L-fucosidase 2